MLEINEKKILQLLSYGIDKEIISFEYDIPIEKIDEYIKSKESKTKLNKENKKKIKNRKSKDDENEKCIENIEESLKENAEAVDYDAIIEKYKNRIQSESKEVITNRNLLAFAYLKSGKIEEARKELLSLIDEHNSCTAYRQLIYLEKTAGNYEDAKIWSYEAIDRFPEKDDLKRQLDQIKIDELQEEIR